MTQIQWYYPLCNSWNEIEYPIDLHRNIHKKQVLHAAHCRSEWRHNWTTYQESHSQSGSVQWSYKHLQQQPSPIAQALYAFQSDSTNIADTCEQWLNLTPCPELEPYHNKLHKGFEQAPTPSHFLAILLHRVCRGKKLKDDHINAAQSCYWTEILILSQIYWASYLIRHWRLCVDRCGAINTGLCKIACQLMSMPASSAATEHVFSNFGVMQTKLRNRLGLFKAAKLVTCYRFLLLLSNTV